MTEQEILELRQLEEALNREVYSNYLNDADAEQKHHSNQLVYYVLKPFALVEVLEHGKSSTTYSIKETDDRTKLTPAQKALIATGGNLISGFVHKGGNVVRVFR